MVQGCRLTRVYSLLGQAVGMNGRDLARVGGRGLCVNLLIRNIILFVSTPKLKVDSAISSQTLEDAPFGFACLWVEKEIIEFCSKR